MFDENMDKTSIYRMHRVRTYTNYHTDSENTDTTTNNDPDMELDGMVMIGDTVCGNLPLKTGNTCLAVAKISSIRDIKYKKFLTVAAIAMMGDHQFQLNVFHASIHDEKLKFLYQLLMFTSP